MGVSTLKSLKIKHIEKIRNWLDQNHIVEVDYQDLTKNMVDKILEDFSLIKAKAEKSKKPDNNLTVKRLRKMLLKRIAAAFI